METVEKRGGFSGKLGFLLATAGAAVGLGNLWRFPYLAEQYGGGIFLLVYLILVVTFGVAMLITELAIGRRTGKSCFDALMELCDRYPIIGWIAMLVPMIIVPYYCVIGGWVTKYFADYAVGAGSDLAGSGFFNGFISMDLGGLFDNPLPWFLIYAFLTIIVVVFGVEKGIERMSKILMPALFVLLIAICVYMMTIDGISEGLKYYLVPDFDKLSFSTVAGAVSQLFYSLSIAMGITIAYGSYMRKQDNIEKSAYTVALTDTTVAFLSGLMIVPAFVLFSSSTEMSSGFGLLFTTMPEVFNTMPGGEYVGIAFFLLAMFAALTSSIALMEAVVAVLRDHWRMTRIRACLIVSAGIIVLGLLSCLGFGPLEMVSFFGMSFLEFFDFITNSVMMPIVALATCLMVGYIVKTRYVIEEVESSGCEFRIKNFYSVMVKYVCPVILVVILVVGILGGLGVYTI